MKTHMIPMLAIGLISVSASKAELLINEPFDYATPTVDGTTSTAVGLTDTWVASGQPDGTVVQTTFLADSLTMGNHFPAVGGALEVTNPGGGNWGPLGASALIDANLDHPVLWTSSLMRVTSGDGVFYNDWRVEHRLNVGAVAGAGTSAIRVLARSPGSGSSAQSRAALGADHTLTQQSDPGTLPAGEVLLFVTKTTLTAGVIDGSTLHVFNQTGYGAYLLAATADPTQAESLLATHAILTLTDTDIDTAGTSPNIGDKAELQFSISGGPIGTFDDVRFGTELADVVNLNAAPEFDLEIQSASLDFTGGTIVVADVETAVVDDTRFNEIALKVNGVSAPVSASKQNNLTAVNFTATIEPNTPYTLILTVPRDDGGSQMLETTVNSHRLPQQIAGIAGIEGDVGTWGIREYPNPPDPEDPLNPDLPLAQDIASAVDVATDAAAAGTFTEMDGIPVLNHHDPDTNGPTTSGNFNNDFPILSDTSEDDDWVVVAKTRVSVPAAGIHTFSVHSDDGFVMRVEGGAGGRFIAVHGNGMIDSGDDQSILFDGSTADSSTRGVYEFDGAGIYDITYFGWDGGGGGYHELAWAEGTFTEDRATSTWQLVGSPDDPSVPPFEDRFVPTLPGPPSTDGNFSIRTYLQVEPGPGNITQVNNFVRDTTRTPSDPDGLTIDGMRQVLNAHDPQDGGGGGLFPSDPFVGNTTSADDNVITVAKARITIPATETYTFWVQSDDGFMLRFKGVDGNPDPKFDRATQGGDEATGRFEMSHPNELFFENTAANADTRGIITLEAGSYDLEFMQWEGGGGFYYELVAATGSWPHGTTPPDGWQLVGFVPPAELVVVPGIADPGWSVESSNAGRQEIMDSFSIAGAEAVIDQALADGVGSVSEWDTLNFIDPENGAQGTFAPSNPWPLDIAADDDNYAMRATSILVIDSPGTYHLGFQGDDGGYMQIDGPLESATSTAEWSSIVFTNHPDQAVLVPGDSGGGLNNRMAVEVGTGNSRTVGAIDLAVGTYTVKTLVYEGGGGSWWEVFGAKAPLAPTFEIPLLERGGAQVITVIPGIQLTAQDPVIGTPPGTAIPVASFTVLGSPVSSVTLSFGSETDRTYKIMASLNLIDWFEVEAAVPASGTGTTSTTVDIAAIPELANQPRVFFNIVIN